MKDITLYFILRTLNKAFSRNGLPTDSADWHQIAADRDLWRLLFWGDMEKLICQRQLQGPPVHMGRTQERPRKIVVAIKDFELNKTKKLLYNQPSR